MPGDGGLVLGIDAAWTPHGSSGVALIERSAGRWQLVRLASSYAQFCSEAGAGLADVLAHCRQSFDRSPDVVAIDMPLSLRPIVTRRVADDSVSRRFGAVGCSTHTPSPQRPGPLADATLRAAADMGCLLRVATASDARPAGAALIEVYPHVALLALCEARYRLPYKAQKTRSYWPHSTTTERRALVAAEQARIARALSGHIDGLPILLAPVEAASFAALKPVEDMIDALVCAWMGAEFVDNRATPLGDAHSATWVPAHGLPC